MSDVHSFNVDVATRVGIKEAVILGHVKFWCDKNRANGKHLHDGLYWTYNTSAALTTLYPYMSQSSISRALRKLVDEGLMRSETFNQDPRDRTKWYALTEEGYAAFGETMPDHSGDAPFVKSTNDISQSDQSNTLVKMTDHYHILTSYRTSSKDTRIEAPRLFDVAEEPDWPSLRKKIPPTLEWVTGYCKSRGSSVDPTYFVDYYEARGWRLKGGNRMQDWQAAVRNWERNGLRRREESGERRSPGYDRSAFERYQRSIER